MNNGDLIKRPCQKTPQYACSQPRCIVDRYSKHEGGRDATVGVCVCVGCLLAGPGARGDKKLLHPGRLNPSTGVQLVSGGLVIHTCIKFKFSFCLLSWLVLDIIYTYYTDCSCYVVHECFHVLCKCICQ